MHTQGLEQLKKRIFASATFWMQVNSIILSSMFVYSGVMLPPTMPKFSVVEDEAKLVLMKFEGQKKEEQLLTLCKL